MIKVLIVSLFLAVGLTAQAGPITSGGGDAVVCYTDSTRATITSVQMFDYWEQHQVLSYPGGINLGASTLTVQQKIELATDRIKRIDPDLADKIKTVALSMANNISYYVVTSYQLPEINDANPKAIPSQPNCFIEQYAVQYKDLVSGQRRFFIADKFYNFAGTSNNDKAGILLHEAIYRIAILNGATNSDGVRYFNYAMVTSKIADIELDRIDKYIKVLDDSNMNFRNCRKEKTDFYVSFSDPLDSEVSREMFCYNQIGKLNGTKVLVADGDLMRIIAFERGSYWEIFSYELWEKWDGKKYTFYIKDETGVEFPYAATALQYFVPTQTTKFMKVSNTLGSPDLRIDGPMSLKYRCITDYDANTFPRNPYFDLLLKDKIYFSRRFRDNPSELSTDSNGKINSCVSDQLVTKNSIDYKIAYLKNELPNRWYVHTYPNYEIKIAGSVNGLTAFTYTGLSPEFLTQNEYVINSNLELVRGVGGATLYNAIVHADGSLVEVNVDGESRMINRFDVLNIDSQVTLKFSSFKTYTNPLIDGKRILASTPYSISNGKIRGNMLDNFCKLRNYSDIGSIDFENTYIAGVQEFYKLSTDQNVVVADEYVDLIGKVTCEGIISLVTY